MSNLLSDLDINSIHQSGRPFDPAQVKSDFKLFSKKKRSETLDIVRSRLDNEEVSSIRNYAVEARLYDDLLAEHKRLIEHDL